MVYLASSGWWANLGTIIISAASLGLYFVFANALPKETYGTYQYLLSLGGIVSAFTLTGMGTAVARSVARGYEGAFRESIRVQLLWGLLPLTGSLIVAGYYFLQGNMVLGTGFVIIGLLSPITTTFNTYSSFLLGKKDFRAGFLYGMSWNLPYYGALIFAALLTHSALVILLANFVSQAVALYVIYQRVLVTYQPNDKTEPETTPYGKHLSAMNFLNTIAAQIDTVLVFQFLGPVELALYSFATAIPERCGGLFKFLQNAAFPKFSSKTATEVRQVFGIRFLWAIIAALLLAGAYAVTAPYLFQLLFPAYLEAIPYTQAYSLIIVASLSGLFTTALTAQRNIQRLYVFNIMSPLTQIGLQLAGVIFYGFWGLIIARLLSSFLGLVAAGVLLLTSKNDPNEQSSASV